MGYRFGLGNRGGIVTTGGAGFWRRSFRNSMYVLEGSAEHVLQWQVIVLGWRCGPAEGWRSVLDAGQSLRTALLLLFLTCCWSLMTLAALLSICASIFIYTHTFIRLPLELSLLSEETRCSPKLLIPWLASPCSLPSRTWASGSVSQLWLLGVFLSYPRKKLNWRSDWKRN